MTDASSHSRFAPSWSVTARPLSTLTQSTVAVSGSSMRIVSSQVSSCVRKTSSSNFAGRSEGIVTGPSAPFDSLSTHCVIATPVRTR